MLGRYANNCWGSVSLIVRHLYGSQMSWALIAIKTEHCPADHNCKAEHVHCQGIPSNDQGPRWCAQSIRADLHTSQVRPSQTKLTDHWQSLSMPTVYWPVHGQSKTFGKHGVYIRMLLSQYLKLIPNVHRSTKDPLLGPRSNVSILHSGNPSS